MKFKQKQLELVENYQTFIKTLSIIIIITTDQNQVYLQYFTKTIEVFIS